MFSRIATIWTLILLVVTGICAQEKTLPEYGDISEIKDMHRVYVHSDDYHAREIILKEIAKEKSLEVVGKIEEAEFIIGFGDRAFGTGFMISSGTVIHNSAQVGDMYVYIRGEQIDEHHYRPRILWAKRNTRSYSGAITFSRHPATNTTREFLKVLKKVRDRKA